MEEWSDQLLPEGFRKRMLRLLGKEAEDAFLASYSAAPLRRGLRVNTLKCGISSAAGAVFPAAGTAALLHRRLFSAYGASCRR